jgi:hypothetical protein
MTKKVSRDYKKILDSSTLKSGYKDEMNKLNEEKVDADNPRLLQMIREHFIVPPSNLPYNLAEINKRDTSMGQAAFVDNRLGYKVSVLKIRIISLIVDIAIPFHLY